MSLSDAEIALVVSELGPLLIGARVGKVWDRDGQTLEIELGPRVLVLSAHPQASRLYLLDGPPSPRDAPPTAFAMLLRKRLAGSRLSSFAVSTPGERCVELSFRPGGDCVVAELTGTHANLFLLDPGRAVVAALRRLRAGNRPLAIGEPYTPPPAPAAPRWRGSQRFGLSPGVSQRVAAHYAAELRRVEEIALRQKATSTLARDIARTKRRERAILDDLRRADEALTFRKLGDLLYSNLSRLPGRGARSATVPDDFEDGSPLTIALDPALDARQNAERYYRQHRRLGSARKPMEARLEATRAELEALHRRASVLPTLTLEELRQVAHNILPSPGRTTPTAVPYRVFRSVTGEVIWIGKSAGGNDALTFRHANGSDVWLHTRDAAGAHVIVRAAPGRHPAEATLLDAATLAAHFSPLRHEEQVDVTWTHVKHLRKPRNAPAGAVYVSEAKTIRVRMEPRRIERLLSERER